MDIYETLCPACRRFYTELFKPNFMEFKSYIEFTLVPYGFPEVVYEYRGNDE